MRLRLLAALAAFAAPELARAKAATRSDEISAQQSSNTATDGTEDDPPENVVERGYTLYRARSEGRTKLDACHENEHMLAAPCFINEGDTEVEVSNIKGYTFGCPNVHKFSCKMQLANAGRNQRCVACARRWWGSCSLRTLYDQSCG
tara:strand:+ start:237 stop:677 length:441 start_codon:yes stop_codon:yes gene_type:complete